MNSFLQFFLLLPFFGFVISLFIPRDKEKTISQLAFSTVSLQLLTLIGFTLLWILQGSPDLDLKELTVLKTVGYEFFIDFYLDKVTIVYSLLGAFLTLMITTYSRYYLHREPGYKRFFCTVLFFFFGYNLVLYVNSIENKW